MHKILWSQYCVGKIGFLLSTDTTFMNYQHLTTELERLEENRLRIRNEGEVLSSHWVDSTKARGKIYHRLRRWNGRRSEFVRTLKLEELAEIKTMCDRARQLEKVNHRTYALTEN